jgi:hypothetical protein
MGGAQMNYATMPALAVVAVMGVVTGPAAVLDKLFPLLLAVLEYSLTALLTATRLVMAFVALLY